MKEIYHEPFHYRHRTFFVGLFILIPLLIVPAFIAVSLVKADLFERWRTVYVRYESAQALQSGSAVNIRGIKVGHVKDVVLDGQGRVVARLRIRGNYAPLVRTTTVARLKQKNFVVGDWEIELAGGHDNALPAQNGDTLAGVCPLQLDATLQQVTGMVASMDSLVCSIRSGDGLLGQFLAGDSLEQIAERVKMHAERLMNNVDRTLTDADNMIRKLALFGESGKTAADSFQVFAREAGLLVEDAVVAVRRLDTVIQNVASIPAGADSLIGDLRYEIRQADTLLMALEKHWLFRRSVDKVRKGE